MNLTTKIGNISIAVEEIGLDIKVEGIEVSTTDVNPVDYIQVMKAKKEHAAEVNKAINSIIGAIKEGVGQQAPKPSNPFAGMGMMPPGIKIKQAPSQGDLNEILGALKAKSAQQDLNGLFSAIAKDLKEAAEEAKKEQEKGGQQTPPFPFPGFKF